MNESPFRLPERAFKHISAKDAKGLLTDKEGVSYILNVFFYGLPVSNSLLFF